MNNKLKNIAKSFSLSLSANIVSLLISVLTVLIVPKVLDITQYSYWQLYIFYSGYVAFFHFGWVDGIYLRYGGQEYTKLKKDRFVTQFWLLTSFEIILFLILVSSVYFLIPENEKSIILIFTFISGFLSILKTFFLFILQATYLIKKYSFITILDRILSGIFIIILVVLKISSYKVYIIIDLVTKVISLLYAIISCKDIVFGKFENLRSGIKEAFDNIKVGIKILLAYIASSLIIGIVRFGIEQNWDIATFGKVSMTLSLSSLLMVFINAVSNIMFPLLKREKNESLPLIYTRIRTILMLILCGTMLLYYPFKMILNIWLPQYCESIEYMALMFPMCIFESKMSLLVNTYLKALRKENTIFIVNILSVIMSIFVTLISVYICNDLKLTVVSIVLLLAFRCIFAELLLERSLKIKIKNDIVCEFSLASLFIILNWNGGSITSGVIYFVAFVIYVLYKKRQIKDVYLECRKIL